MVAKLIITGRFQRVILLCHLLNTFLLHFLPKKLSSLLRSRSSSRHPDKAAAGAAAAAAAAAASSTTTSEQQGAEKENSRRKEEENNMADESATTSTPRGGQEAMDPAELKRVFQMFDRNGDGTITRKELSESLENLGIYIPEEELAAMIGKIDVNGDGCVDIDEFGALYKTIMDERDEEEDMREAFNVFDQNGDGFITVDELRSVLASLGLKQGRTVEDCRRMINKVDVDGDGMVDFKEFKQMMRGGGFAALS